MKSVISSVFYLLILVVINNDLYSQVNKVMTYNIKYDDINDSINNWDKRKLEVIELFEYYEPEIFGIQEGLEHQLSDLDKHLVNYARIGVGRNDGKAKGEFCAIYYNENRYRLIDESTFWLSDQNDAISIGWDASMERICTYGLFENTISKDRVLVFNTHYDHVGPMARAMSSTLILNKIRAINEEDYPVIVMGDFNAEPETSPIKILKQDLKDGAELSPHGIYGPEGTYTGFKTGASAKRRIDYIFVKGLDVMKYRHIDDKMKNDNYLSDHLPVLVEFK